MNKVFRLLGSATLATGLVLGGSAGIASAHDSDRNDKRSSYDRDRDRHDRDHDRKCRHDDNRHHNHYSNHRDGRDNRDCDHRHERVYYKDHNGNWKFIVIVVYNR